MISRREFLISGGSAAMGMAAGVLYFGKGNSVGSVPDLIVHNGQIYTSDPVIPKTEAFAVKSDRFMAVGSNADILNLATRKTKVVDAKGMTLVPGFI
ncbi:MAG TPA: hypothetical protein EYO34_04945, partial [Candidatus Marinimicrobia bacterium]|nr:hypothetical protein [Candidatus Neomarinimicrobiota bacterium]